MIAVLPVNVGSWFVGLWAVYKYDLSLYSTVFILNISLAVVIFCAHILGNPEVIFNIISVCATIIEYLFRYTPCSSACLEKLNVAEDCIRNEKHEYR